METVSYVVGVAAAFLIGVMILGVVLFVISRWMDSPDYLDDDHWRDG